MSPYIAGGLVVVLAASHWGIYEHGRSVERKEWEAKPAEVVPKQQEITTRVETKIVYQDRVIQGETKTVIKKVPVYVTKDDDVKCSIPAAVPGLLNEANFGVPRATASADAATRATGKAH